MVFPYERNAQGFHSLPGAQPSDLTANFGSALQKPNSYGLRRMRRVTYRSFLPWPPARSEKKYNSVPSQEIDGAPSNEVLFTPAPRFTGVDQALSALDRVDTHTSWPPMPSGRPVTS